MKNSMKNRHRFICPCVFCIYFYLSLIVSYMHYTIRKNSIPRGMDFWGSAGLVQQICLIIDCFPQRLNWRKHKMIKMYFKVVKSEHLSKKSSSLPIKPNFLEKYSTLTNGMINCPSNNLLFYLRNSNRQPQSVSFTHQKGNAEDVLAKTIFTLCISFPFPNVHLSFCAQYTN